MSIPPQGNVYLVNSTAPPPTYNEAMGSAPPPGFKPASGFGPDPVYVQPGMLGSGGPTPVVHAHVGPQPMALKCPNCGLNVETMTKSEPGVIAYISGVLIFLFGFWCGCCLIPCCLDGCMDVHHSCPNCKAYLGRYRR